MYIYPRQQFPNLSGTWYNAAYPAGQMPTQIIQSADNMLQFINEMGQKSIGYFVNTYLVFAIEWGLNGRLTPDLRQIFWSNGTVWAR